ncbi:MAG: pilus assembly protein TadG-related protein [Promicromonosporaceae bacterium]|nr:pilus assembly protein TadG-related protein [Promicromonosporaceae bacterium]
MTGTHLRHPVRSERQRLKSPNVRLVFSDSERGAGTVLALGLIAVIALLGLSLGALGAAQQARVAAQTAADLAALAGASAGRWGYDACAIAETAVSRNGAALASCDREEGGVIRITATRRAATLPTWAGGLAAASARAGPRYQK